MKGVKSKAVLYFCVSMEEEWKHCFDNGLLKELTILHLSQYSVPGRAHQPLFHLRPPGTQSDTCI